MKKAGLLLIITCFIFHSNNSWSFGAKSSKNNRNYYQSNSYGSGSSNVYGRQKNNSSKSSGTTSSSGNNYYNNSNKSSSSASSSKSSSNSSTNSSNSSSSSSTGKIKKRDSFAYQLDGSIKNHPVKVYFIDLFDNSSSKINMLKQNGKVVICYFSAGTSENWRSDYGRFPSSVKGGKVDGWSGERWLNTKSSTVLDIMKDRIDLAKSKGCHGIDPDNVDGFDNNTGFSLSKSDSTNYLKNLASYAHSKGLMMGLKNSAEIASSLSSTLDFAVVEECHQWNECSSYNGFTSKNKAVFQIEYTRKSNNLCNNAKNMGATLIFADWDLDGNISYCN